MAHANPIIYRQNWIDFFFSPVQRVSGNSATRNVVRPIKAYFHFRQYLVPMRICTPMRDFPAMRKTRLARPTVAVPIAKFFFNRRTSSGRRTSTTITSDNGRRMERWNPPVLLPHLLATLDRYPVGELI